MIERIRSIKGTGIEHLIINPLIEDPAANKAYLQMKSHQIYSSAINLLNIEYLQ